MRSIFLSAGVPNPSEPRFFESADPFLIHLAVRQLVIATARAWRIVWGGHPAITPMIWQICEDLGVTYSETFQLYQSAYFADDFPDENRQFNNVEIIASVQNDRQASLDALRTTMLKRTDLCAAVFIGGMSGVLEEYETFRRYHPDARVIPVGATGGAARELADSLDVEGLSLHTVDFSALFLTAFGEDGR